MDNVNTPSQNEQQNIGIPINPEENKHSSRRAFFLSSTTSVILIFILLGAVLTGAAFYAFPKIISIFLSPEEVLIKSMMTLQETSSFTYEGHIQYVAKEDSSGDLFKESTSSDHDAARIADIKQIQILLELYYDDYGLYAPTLSTLEEGMRSRGLNTSTGKDPVTRENYFYAVRSDGKNYHLGAALADKNSVALQHDRDFDSRKAAWTNGFSGDDSLPCGSSVSGFCYDVAGIEESALRNKIFQTAGLLFNPVRAQSIAPSPQSYFQTVFSFDVDGSVRNGKDKRTSVHARMTLDPGSFFGDSIGYDINAQYTPEEAFFKVGGSEENPFSMLIPDDDFAAELRGKWLRVGTKDATDLFSVLPEEIAYNENVVKGAQDLFAESIRSGKLLSIIELPRETINGETAYHYQFIADNEKLIRLYVDILKLTVLENDEDELFDEETILEAISEFDVSIRGDIWIGKNTFYPYKVTISVIDPEDPSDELAIEFLTSDHNKPVEFEPIEDPVDFSAILEKSLNESRRNSRNARRVADTKQLALAAELYYDANNNGYPTALSVLEHEQIGVIPTDPSNGVLYAYSVSPDRHKYHIGASLEGDNSALQSDGDFDSRKVGWTNGFSGDDTASCSVSHIGDTCFDVIGESGKPTRSTFSRPTPPPVVDEKKHPQFNGLAWDGAYLWATSYVKDAGVYKIHPVDGSVASKCNPAITKFSGSYAGVAFDGMYLWVADFYGDGIYKLNPVNCSVVGIIPAPVNYVGGLAWDGTYLWVSSGSQGRTIYKISPQDGLVVSEYVLPMQISFNGSVGLAFEGAYLWVSGLNVTYKLDSSTMQILSQKSNLLGRVEGITWDGVRIWIASFDKGLIQNTATGQIFDFSHD